MTVNTDIRNAAGTTPKTTWVTIGVIDYFVVLLVLLVGVTILSIGWHIYRYGGDYYYMRVNGSSGSFPVTVPVGITQNGYIYRGIAKDKYGNRQRLEVQTVADDLGPFHKGQIIRITYNPKFGVTNYKKVSRDQVPPLARLH